MGGLEATGGLDNPWDQHGFQQLLRSRPSPGARAGGASILRQQQTDPQFSEYLKERQLTQPLLQFLSGAALPPALRARRPLKRSSHMEGECSPAASLAALASPVHFTSAHVRTPQGEGCFFCGTFPHRSHPAHHPTVSGKGGREPRASLTDRLSFVPVGNSPFPSEFLGAVFSWVFLYVFAHMASLRNNSRTFYEFIRVFRV